MLKRGYRDLQVWQKAMDLVDVIYALTKAFPQDERFGLTSQLRRSAVSIPSNIAEGSSRRTTKEYMRFVDIAYGSLAEVETQVSIAQRQKYIASKDEEPVYESTSEIGRMLNGLLSSLEQRMEGQSTDRRPLTAVN